jgi:hypothetical protein
MVALRGVAVLSIDPRFRAGWNRDIKAAADLYAEELGRCDAHDFHWTAVQRQLLPDRLRVSGELALPERIADHRSRRTASPPVIFIGNHAAHQRLDSQCLEKVAAHPQALRISRLAARGQIESRVAPSEDAGKRLLMIADLLPLRIGKIRPTIGEVARAAVLVIGDH